VTSRRKTYFSAKSPQEIAALLNRPDKRAESGICGYVYNDYIYLQDSKYFLLKPDRAFFGSIESSGTGSLIQGEYGISMRHRLFIYLNYASIIAVVLLLSLLAANLTFSISYYGASGQLYVHSATLGWKGWLIAAAFALFLLATEIRGGREGSSVQDYITSDLL
jgi:hypothetical protein